MTQISTELTEDVVKGGKERRAGQRAAVAPPPFASGAPGAEVG